MPFPSGTAIHTVRVAPGTIGSNCARIAFTLACAGCGTNDDIVFVCFTQSFYCEDRVSKGRAQGKKENVVTHKIQIEVQASIFIIKLKMLDKRAEGFVAALAGQVASTTMLSEVVLNGGSEADRVVDAAIGTVDDAELQQLLKQLGALVLEVGFFY